MNYEGILEYPDRARIVFGIGHFWLLRSAVRMPATAWAYYQECGIIREDEI